MLPTIGFLTAVTFWPGMAGAAEDSRWVTLYVALPIALCFTVVPLRLWSPQSHGASLTEDDSHRGQPHHEGGGIIFALVAAFLIWASLSLLWTTVPYDGIEGMVHLGVIVCAFALASQCRDLRPFYSWLGLGLWVSSGIAIAQWFGYQPVVTGYSQVYPTGLFINSNLLGEISAVVLVALVAYRTWWIAIGLLPAVVLSGHRASWLALAVVFIAYITPIVGRRAIAAIAALVVVALVLARDYTWSQRADIWWDTAHGLTFFGWGIGSFYSTFTQFSHLVGADYIQLSHAHNDLLELAFELGVPGLVLALAATVACYAAAEARERLVLVALGVTAMCGFPLHTPTTALVFGVVAGHAARGWHSVRFRELLGGSALYGGRWGTPPSAARAGSKAISV